jgi:membrane fusion protein, multidrug efflux system
MTVTSRTARAGLALAAALTLTAAANAQVTPPQVTVAPPLASRVAQWDEFTGRFEAMERVEVRPRVSGYIDKVHSATAASSTRATCCSP